MMPSSRFGMTDGASLGQTGIDPMLIAAPQNLLVETTQSCREHHLLQETLYGLELARNILIAQNFQGDRALALDAIERASESIQRAMESNRGYAVLHLPCRLQNS